MSVAYVDMKLSIPTGNRLGKSVIASLRRSEDAELRFDVSGPKVYGLLYQHAPRGVSLVEGACLLK